jgi:hypothetical protein
MDMQRESPAPLAGGELRKHFREIESGNRADRLWMEDERFDEIVSLCEIARSHLVSAREAGYRRDRSLLGEPSRPRS